MNDASYLVMSFHCTTDSIQTERRAKEVFPAVAVMPTPRAIAAGCGLSLRFPAEATLEEVVRFHNTLEIPCDLHCITVGEDQQTQAQRLNPEHP